MTKLTSAQKAAKYFFAAEPKKIGPAEIYFEENYAEEKRITMRLYNRILAWRDKAPGELVVKFVLPRHEGEVTATTKRYLNAVISGMGYPYKLRHDNRILRLYPYKLVSPKAIVCLRQDLRPDGTYEYQIQLLDEESGMKVTHNMRY